MVKTRRRKLKKTFEKQEFINELQYHFDMLANEGLCNGSGVLCHFCLLPIHGVVYHDARPVPFHLACRGHRCVDPWSWGMELPPLVSFDSDVSKAHDAVQQLRKRKKNALEEHTRRKTCQQLRL